MGDAQGWIIAKEEEGVWTLNTEWSMAGKPALEMKLASKP